MSLKDLSPAFLTSLAGIILAAIFMSINSTVMVGVGWVLVVVSIALNVVSAMISLRRAKGEAVPGVTADADRWQGLEPGGGPRDDREDYTEANTQVHSIVPGPDRSGQSQGTGRVRPPRPPHH